MPALIQTAGLLAAAVIGLSLALSLVLRLVWRRAFYRPWGFADPKDSDVGGIELVDLAEAEDEHLYLWHLPPAVPGAPVLVFFDGVRGNLALWNRRWRRIAAAGAGFVAVSYRGYGGSTGRPSEPGMAADCAAALDWARGAYPEDRLVLHGYSMGCAFAARLAADTDRPLVLEGAGLSVRHAIARVAPFLVNTVAVRDGLRVAPWLRRARGPLLIAHGRRDRVIPLRIARALYARAREPKTLAVFDAGNHVNLSVQGLYPRLWAWLGYAPGGAWTEAMYTEEAAPPDAPLALPGGEERPALLARAASRPLRPLARAGRP